jgi:methionyl-tRNA formyltransferase
MAVHPLRELIAAGFDVALVVTRVDKRRGRGSQLLPSPVKVAALELGLPVSHSVDDALEVGADLGVVVAFGQLIKAHVLDVLPMVNLHFSLLPRWRGAAPVERALLAGDCETGVCLMSLEKGLDTGPVFRCEVVPIGATMTAIELREELVAVGTRTLVDELTAGLGEAQPQVGEPTYAAKLRAEELQIDWSAPTVEIDRLVRLGGAWTTLHGRRLRIVAAELADDSCPPSDELRGDRVGGLKLVTVQPEGKAPMPFDAFARGARLAEVEHLRVIDAGSVNER